MKKTGQQQEPQNDTVVVAAVQKWVKTFVIEMNLCPFAKAEVLNDRMRYSTTAAETEEQLLLALQDELQLLTGDSSVETTLLIHPRVLQGFDDYNQFLSYTDELLRELDLEGVIQVASFHPEYQFGGTEPDDAENYTNRSPYPLLHLIREESLQRAIASYPDVAQIPVRNVGLMNDTGVSKLKRLFENLFNS